MMQVIVIALPHTTSSDRLRNPHHHLQALCKPHGQRNQTNKVYELSWERAADPGGPAGRIDYPASPDYDL